VELVRDVVHGALRLCVLIPIVGSAIFFQKISTPGNELNFDTQTKQKIMNGAFHKILFISVEVSRDLRLLRILPLEHWEIGSKEKTLSNSKKELHIKKGTKCKQQNISTS
jgi:hypothetical protein